MFRVNPNVANALAPRIWGLTVVPDHGHRRLAPASSVTGASAP